MGRRREHLSPSRNYRRQTRPQQGEVSFQVVVEQSDLWVTARTDLSSEVHGLLRELRGGLKAYMTLNPGFGTSLAPLPQDPHAPPLAREMLAAAVPWQVGPMAAVAGTIAEAVALAILPHSPEVIVENGGDVYLCSDRDRVVGLLPEPDSDVVLGLHLERDRFPLAVCASSAVIGHSLSLGSGDLVVALGPNGAFADAAATALCNMLTSRKDLSAVVDAARKLSIPSGDRPESHVLTGLVAQLGPDLTAWGDIEFTTL